MFTCRVEAVRSFSTSSWGVRVLFLWILKLCGPRNALFFLPLIDSRLPCIHKRKRFYSYCWLYYYDYSNWNQNWFYIIWCSIQIGELKEEFILKSCSISKTSNFPLSIVRTQIMLRKMKLSLFQRNFNLAYKVFKSLAKHSISWEWFPKFVKPSTAKYFMAWHTATFTFTFPGCHIQNSTTLCGYPPGPGPYSNACWHPAVQFYRSSSIRM